MHHVTRAVLVASAAALALPGLGLADDDASKPDAERPAHCERGAGYTVRGTVAEGGTLEQVAGAETKRRGDDRYSGTVVVEVRHGNKRGRADRGLTSYDFKSIRIRSPFGSEMPGVGTRVTLVGRVVKPECVTSEPGDDETTETTPSPSPSPSVAPEAARAELEGDDPAEIEEPTEADEVAEDEVEIRDASGRVTVKRITFKRSKAQQRAAGGKPQRERGDRRRERGQRERAEREAEDTAAGGERHGGDHRGRGRGGRDRG